VELHEGIGGGVVREEEDRLPEGVGGVLQDGVVVHDEVLPGLNFWGPARVTGAPLATARGR
jgi:hypothetical protein